MVADDEDDDPKSEYVQPIPDSLESREFDTDPMNAHKPAVAQGHKPSIGNIDMDNGRGLGRLRANFGIGGNAGNTSVGVTEVSCDSEGSEDDEYDTVRVNHVTEGVGGTTINGLDTESIFEGHTGEVTGSTVEVFSEDTHTPNLAVDTHVSTLGAAPSYESIPSYEVSPLTLGPLLFQPCILLTTLLTMCRLEAIWFRCSLLLPSQLTPRVSFWL